MRHIAALLLVALSALPTPPLHEWREDSFFDFSDGTLTDGGANSYISADGSIRLINQWDLNGDGNLDPVFPSSHDNNYGVDSYVYWGRDAFATAGRTALPGNGASGGAVADLNSDGFPDVVVVNEFNGTRTQLNSFIYWGGAKGFSPNRRTELPTVAATAVATGDFNADGATDIAVASSGSSYQFSRAGGDFSLVRPASDIYWGSPKGYSAERTTPLRMVNAIGVVAGDLNRDGIDDLAFVVRGDEQHPAGILLQPGAKGHLPIQRHFVRIEHASAVEAADVDRDGWKDLLVARGRRARLSDPVLHPVGWSRRLFHRERDLIARRRRAGHACRGFEWRRPSGRSSG